MTDEQIQKAYLIWKSNYENFRCEKEIKAPASGWLRKAREALLMTMEDVAVQLHVSKPAYAKFENAEKNGQLKLATITKIAEAMNCEVVYTIKPKEHLLFSQVVWRKILPKATEHCWVQSRPERAKHLALAAIAIQLTNDPKFRRDQKFSKRRFLASRSTR